LIKRNMPASDHNAENRTGILFQIQPHTAPRLP